MPRLGWVATGFVEVPVLIPGLEGWVGYGRRGGPQLVAWSRKIPFPCKANKCLLNWLPALRRGINYCL